MENPPGQLEYVNPRSDEVLGLPSHHLVGRSSLQLFHDPEEGRRCREQLAQARSISHLETCLRHASGRPVPVLLSACRLGDEADAATLLIFDDLSHKQRKLQAAIEVREREIERQKAYRERLEYSAHHDALTHLPNRQLFRERTKQALETARTGNRKVAILFLDLDGFKEINDLYGHVFGDRLLLVIAERLRQAVRHTDTVARFGGDEFVIAVAIASAADAEAAAENIVRVLAAPIKLDGITLRVGASVGISVAASGDQDLDLLLREADEAMYAAKREGGDGWLLHPRTDSPC